MIAKPESDLTNKTEKGYGKNHTRGPAWRLVGRDPLSDPQSPPETITDPNDPRWVLALRTAAQLQGSILSPERRERLARLGRLLGLSVFDTNLIIAIVQDRARRGHAPGDCPAAAEPQLRMVPRPVPHGWLDAFRGRIALRIALLVTLIITLEILLLMWLF